MSNSWFRASTASARRGRSESRQDREEEDADFPVEVDRCRIACELAEDSDAFDAETLERVLGFAVRPFLRSLALEAWYSAINFLCSPPLRRSIAPRLLETAQARLVTAVASPRSAVSVSRTDATDLVQIFFAARRPGPVDPRFSSLAKSKHATVEAILLRADECVSLDRHGLVAVKGNLGDNDALRYRLLNKPLQGR